MEQASNLVRKWSLTATMTFMPLLHKWPQLTRQDGVTAFWVFYRVIPFMNLLSQKPAWYLPELSELANSKFSGQFQLHFSISCHESGLLWWIKLYWSSSTPQSKLIKKNWLKVWAKDLKTWNKKIRPQDRPVTWPYNLEQGIGRDLLTVQPTLTPRVFLLCCSSLVLKVKKLSKHFSRHSSCSAKPRRPVRREVRKFHWRSAETLLFS